MKGKLYIVASPIGNLEDITLRAIKVLQEVDIIAAEDTRHSLKLLNHLKISKPLISYHRHNEEIKTDLLISKLKEGKNIALVSDAGTPVISDPGEEIVKEAIVNQIEVIPIPGACAAINALVASGLTAKEFCFFGFLPINKKLRKEKLEQIRNENKTTILYEAPHKLENTLKELELILSDRKVVLAKELTKIHEFFYRGNIKDIRNQIGEPKGEFIILIEGNPTKEEESKKELNELTIEEHYEFYEKQGYTKKEIIKKIAKDRNVNLMLIFLFCLNFFCNFFRTF